MDSPLNTKRRFFQFISFLAEQWQNRGIIIPINYNQTISFDQRLAVQTSSQKKTFIFHKHNMMTSFQYNIAECQELKRHFMRKILLAL